jgi:hypothetical protein
MHSFRSEMRVQLLTSSLLIWCLVANGGPSRAPKKALSVTIEVEEQDAPLKIVALRRPQRPGEPPYVHVRNTSSLKTSRFWIEALIISASGGVYRTNDNGPNEFWPAERIISPAEDRWARETVLQTSSLAIAAKELHSTCIRVVPLVMRVDFVNGTSWKSNLEGVTFSSGSRSAAREDACPDPGSVSDDRELFPTIAIGNSVRPNTLEQTEGEKSYTYSCPVVVKDKKRVALCPF